MSATTLQFVAFALRARLPREQEDDSPLRQETFGR